VERYGLGKTSGSICYNSSGLTNRRKEDIAPPTEDKKKLFSEVLCGKIEARHKLTVKPRPTRSTEEIKRMMKSKIDPVNMKIAIRTFKSLKNGNVLIEADSMEEKEALNSQVRNICGDQLEINVQKRRNLRLIIYNVPDVVTPENVKEVILAQNPDLKLQKGGIQSKFIFKTKRNTRTQVDEVNAQTRRQMVQNKIKLDWTICSIDDYVSVVRCFTCSL